VKEIICNENDRKNERENEIESERYNV